MPHSQIKAVIDAAWEDRQSIGYDTKGEVRAAVAQALGLLDRGELRVAEKIEGRSGPGSWRGRTRRARPRLVKTGRQQRFGRVLRQHQRRAECQHRSQRHQGDITLHPLRTFTATLAFLRRTQSHTCAPG